MKKIKKINFKAKLLIVDQKSTLSAILGTCRIYNLDLIKLLFHLFLLKLLTLFNRQYSKNIRKFLVQNGNIRRKRCMSVCIKSVKKTWQIVSPFTAVPDPLWLEMELKHFYLSLWQSLKCIWNHRCLPICGSSTQHDNSFVMYS